MITLALSFLFVIFGSALCSGTEAALLSLPVSRIRVLVEDGRSGAKALQRIRENIGRPLTTIVVFNNVINIVGSMIIGNLAAVHFGSQWLGVVSAVLTFLIIIFSEILPKTFGERYSEKISLCVVRPLHFITVLITPIVWCIECIIKVVVSESTAPTTNEAEIRILTKIGQTEGVIDVAESEMIQRVFELDDHLAKDVMTPKRVITSLTSTQTLLQQKTDILESQHSRLVLTGETEDDILGIVLQTELLVELVTNPSSESSLSQFARPIQSVSEETPANELLEMFKGVKEQLIIVVDEFESVSGVVTLEDVLEILAGEIVDETDEVTDMREFARSILKSRSAQPGSPQ